MKKIYLVRHAKASGQEQLAPLTEEGVIQANKLVDFFAKQPIDKIYSSPFKRALDTIKPIADSKKLTIHTDDRLSERVLSTELLEDWQLKLEQSFQDFSLSLPGGESNSTAMARAVSILEEIIASPEEGIILVSHGNLTTLILRYLNESFGFKELMEMTNPDVFELEVNNGEITFKRTWNDRVFL